jgi:CBS domain-containing protein
MKGITLFIFGGVAEMNDEPPSPKAEFLMAIAGPASSVALGGVFYFAASPFMSAETIAIAGVLGYLALINWVLAVFNMIPAFPLDGGRVLRAGLWHWKKDLRKATKIASRFGSAFGFFLIFFGIANVVIGNVIGGIWQFMIGMFLRSAAEGSYRQVLYRNTLQGKTVAGFMNKEPITAPPSLTIRELVESFIYRYHFKMFPVRQDGKLLGCITSRKVKEIPREEWDRRTVRESLDNCSTDNSIGSGTSAMHAFSQMGRTGVTRLMVVDDEKLVGIISLKDIMGYVSSKMELEDGESNGKHGT